MAALAPYTFQSMDEVADNVEIRTCLRYMIAGLHERVIATNMGHTLEWVRRIRDYPLFREYLEAKRFEAHEISLQLFEEYQSNVVKGLQLQGKMLDEAIEDVEGVKTEEKKELNKDGELVVVEVKEKREAKIPAAVRKALIDSVFGHDPQGKFVAKTKSEQTTRVEIVDTAGVMDIRRRAVERHLVGAIVGDDVFDAPAQLTMAEANNGGLEDSDEV